MSLLLFFALVTPAVMEQYKEGVIMDEMKIKLSTRFMRTVVSKLIARAIYKKNGCKVNIHLNDLDVSIIDGETNIKVNAEVKMDSDEFMKIMKTISSD